MDYIVHTTNQFDNIKSIIKFGFRVKYCVENFDVNKKLGSYAAHPVVCFSDIPIEEIYKQEFSYGNYFIALKKNWAISKGLNPVLYLERNSQISAALSKLLDARRNDELAISLRENIMLLKCFTKNYIGYNENKETSDYPFHKEKEWRYVPIKMRKKEFLISINASKYKDEKKKFNSKISHLRLVFKIQDIFKIIVANNSEKESLIELIYNLNSGLNKESIMSLVITKSEYK
jgi:hypothetical protein